MHPFWRSGVLQLGAAISQAHCTWHELSTFPLPNRLGNRALRVHEEQNQFLRGSPRHDELMELFLDHAFAHDTYFRIVQAGIAMSPGIPAGRS